MFFDFRLWTLDLALDLDCDNNNSANHALTAFLQLFSVVDCLLKKIKIIGKLNSSEIICYQEVATHSSLLIYSLDYAINVEMITYRRKKYSCRTVSMV